jgi:uncharacterized membrane protein
MENRMTDEAVQLIVASFEDEKTASQTLKAMEKAHKEGTLQIDEVAVVQVDKDHKIHIKEKGDMGGGGGAAIGGVLGGVVGVLGGPPGVLLGGAAGAFIGGLIAKRHDAGIPDDRMKLLAHPLKPDTSAIMAEIKPQWEEATEQFLIDAGAHVTVHKVETDLAEQLVEIRDRDYSSPDLSTDEE